MTNQKQSETEQTESVPAENKKSNSYSDSAIVGELLFTLLPFAVLFLVYLYQGKTPQAFLFAPEWAFASTILFGQTVVKFVQGILEATPVFKAISERVGLIVAMLIVLGLVPSMVILVLVLVSPTPPYWIGYMQIGLFILSTIIFLLLGSIAHEQASKARISPSTKKSG